MDEEALAVEKAVWTDADFDRMGWHDATVHALAFEESDDQASLLIDLDYIVRWIEPQPPSRYFSFLVAPVRQRSDYSSGAPLGGVDADLSGTPPARAAHQQVEHGLGR